MLDNEPMGMSLLYKFQIYTLGLFVIMFIVIAFAYTFCTSPTIDESRLYQMVLKAFAHFLPNGCTLGGYRFGSDTRGVPMVLDGDCGCCRCILNG